MDPARAQGRQGDGPAERTTGVHAALEETKKEATESSTRKEVEHAEGLVTPDGLQHTIMPQAIRFRGRFLKESTLIQAVLPSTIQGWKTGIAEHIGDLMSRKLDSCSRLMRLQQ